MHHEIDLTKKGEAYAARQNPSWRGRPIPLTRTAIEDEIERLVDLLDTVDGDCDLEEDGTEDDIATPHRWQMVKYEGSLNEDDEDGGDREPNLGWCPVQYWDHQGRISLERDHDDLEQVDEDGGDIQDEPHDWPGSRL